MRRENPQLAEDQEIVDSREALEEIEGKKSIANAEVLLIADNKKRVEAEAQKRLEGLDQEIEAKQKESREASERHRQLLATNIAEIEQIHKDRDAAQGNAIDARRETTELDAANIEKRQEKEALTASVMTLTAQESAIKSSIKTLELSLEHDKERSVTVKAELAVAEIKLATTNADHARVVPEYEAEKTVHESLKAIRDGRTAENTRLDGEILEKAKKRDALTTELATIERHKIEIETIAIARDAESNVRMSNATKLEQKVDAKLMQLKEFESHFTTEHLARVGYKPIGSS